MAELRRGRDGALRKNATPARGFGVQKRRLFLDELATSCSVRGAARAAGIDQRTAYRTRMRDGEFARLWAAAFEAGQVRLEEELLAHALGQVTGGDNPVGERKISEPAAFDADLALKVLALRARTPGGGGTRAAAPAPTQAEVDAALLKRLQEVAARTAGR